jgi:rhodanese-related sulfurtransferase
MMKRHLLEAATLIIAAILCATIANALASRERKMALAGTYPDALKVPKEAPATPVEPIAAPTTTTAATQATAQVPATAAATTTTAPPTPAAPTATQPLSNSATQPLSHSATTTQPRNPATAQPTPQPTPAAALATPPPTTHHPPPQFKPHPDKPYIEIGYNDVAALHNAGALTLDARRTSIYEQGHIAGARSFSVWESDVDEKVKKLFEERGDPAEQDKPIVIYCSGGDCEDSHMLAQKLWGAQFNNVYVYRDGFPDWQKHGGAIHTGGQP